MHLWVEFTDNNSGAVYVYKRTGTSWAQEAYVKAANNDAQDYLNMGLQVHGGVLCPATIMRRRPKKPAPAPPNRILRYIFEHPYLF